MKKLNILLVEDNAGDIILTQEALKEREMVGHLEIAKNGLIAIEYLDNILISNTQNLPDLILLDINLPKKNGQEVLIHIKSNDNLRHIPVIMLTTSSSEKDIISSYKHYANCYITKPVNIDEFSNTIEKIEDFWLNVAQLPNHKH
jgi:CheY-like chemotaxis protein